MASHKMSSCLTYLYTTTIYRKQIKGIAFLGGTRPFCVAGFWHTAIFLALALQSLARSLACTSFLLDGILMSRPCVVNSLAGGRPFSSLLSTPR